MKEIKFNNIDECKGFINALTMTGQSVPDWAKKQLEEFEKQAKLKNGTADSKTPIYDTLIANAPFKPVDPNKIKCIESTVEQLLANVPNAIEPGLLLGRIQCGKTDTFENIIGLAFDKGIDIAIVLTKGTNPLTEQTIKRMEKDYRFFARSNNLKQKATISIYDIMKIHKQGLVQAVVDKEKTVIVCKKQKKNLEHLMDLFKYKCPFLRQKKVLVVDDEADFASRNYRSSRNNNINLQTAAADLAIISQQIDDFRLIPIYCRYLQVTATPYCLYLQPEGYINLVGGKAMPFRPRFTTLVPVHDKYVGGKQYFEDSQVANSMYSYLYHRIDDKCLEVLGKPDMRYVNNPSTSKNIFGLTYAIMSYLMATAIRRIQRREEGYNYQSSALVHVELFKKNHDWQEKIVKRIMDAIEEFFIKGNTNDIWIAMANVVCMIDLTSSIKAGIKEGKIKVRIPAINEVGDELKKMFIAKDIRIQIVNSNQDVKSLLDAASGELRLDAAANIFIGGNILDRGITIKNMLCFFYGRNPRNFQQDTVLQHARMYGARDLEDMAVTRMHTTARIYQTLSRINALDNQLREWFIAGYANNESNAIFVGYDSNIKPCSPQKIQASNALSLRGEKRILPLGFWTGSATSTKKTMGEIDNLITSSKNYAKKDKDGFFMMEKEEVTNIIKKIRMTYKYDAKYLNKERVKDMDEFLCALEYCCNQSKGKIYALHRTNRNMTRIRQNGSFVDAPDDGKLDLAPARIIAKDIPVVMFLRQNGKKELNQYNDNIGWNDAPFYWPVLLTQKELTPVMYTIEQS